MARTAKPLEARKLGKLITEAADLFRMGRRAPVMHSDGNNLYLRIAPSAVEGAPPSATWVFRYMAGKKAHTMGLGRLGSPDRAIVSLADARDLAIDRLRLLAKGRDPVASLGRKATRARAAAERAKLVTFSECVDRFLENSEGDWSNPKHKYQWRQTLALATKSFGNVPVGEVDTAMVMKVLEPIWRTKTETAKRLRGRIEKVLEWARTSGYRGGENPATWRLLAGGLPHPSKVQTKENHPSLPWVQLPAFLPQVAQQDGMAAKALQVTILTALRTTEVIGARWSEIDLDAKVWTVPAARMKMKQEHSVPLAEPVLAILRELHKVRGVKTGDDGYVFPSPAGGQLSNQAMKALLRRMDVAKETASVHGFRATFRSWCADNGVSRELAEKALAHKLESKVEAAYQRSDLFELRRPLMDAWATFATTSAQKKVAA